MGKRAIEIANLDVKELLQQLNEALAEEWLAYYQYWVGARVMEGPMRSEVEPELLLHATEELSHAELVAARIIQLGGNSAAESQTVGEILQMRLRRTHKSIYRGDS